MSAGLLATATERTGLISEGSQINCSLADKELAKLPVYRNIVSVDPLQSRDAPSVSAIALSLTRGHLDSQFLVLREIVKNIDVPLSEEQLRRCDSLSPSLLFPAPAHLPIPSTPLPSPEIQFAIIQPLEAFLADLSTPEVSSENLEGRDPSVVYVLLLCRLHFMRERDSALASFSLNETRAQLCETLAIKLLRHQATTSKGSSAGLLAMSRALVGGFHAFQGADPSVLARIKEKEGYSSRIVNQGAGRTNALELAILGKARGFIKSQATQRVITAIWEGRVVYSSSSFLDILPDRWKVHEIRLYSIKNAPILDHYRLRVPKYRSIIDFFSFLVLFISFLNVVLDRRNRGSDVPVSALTIHEKWFFFYALGYSLDKAASIMEHGWSVYAAGLTNGLDALCLPIFILAFGYRIHSVLYNDMWASDQAFAILSCAACLMFPRLAFAAVSNNLLILSLRAMLADFFWLMGIAVFCFLGFVFALNHMCNGDYSVARIAEWLVFIWFGLDGTGIDKSVTFHGILGPALFVSYAALSNTLLVSLLVAILSSTYATIAADAAAEDMFRKAVMTFEGVKSDSLFDYVPPLNLVALFLMWPISLVASPRWFHKINVATTRILSMPILLLIALYERQSVAGAPLRAYLSQLYLRLTNSLPTKWTHKLSLLEGAHWECEAVFEYPPLTHEKDEDDDDNDDDDAPEDEELPTLGREDEVEDILEHGMRKSSRASAIVSPLPASSRSPGPLPGSSRPSRAVSPAATDSPQKSLDSLMKPTDPKATAPAGKPSAINFPVPQSASPPASPKGFKSPAHAHFDDNRFPSNSSYGAIGISSKGHAGGRDRERSGSENGSAFNLSLSAPHRFESPLAKLYHHNASHHHISAADVESGSGGGAAGVRRRMSMSTSNRSPGTATVDLPPTQMREMLEALTAAMARLESKLDEKEKEKHKK